MPRLTGYVLAVLGVMTVVPPVLAHNGEVPPAPQVQIVGAGGTMPPPRWSWLHWWEANREPYLQRRLQDAPDQAPDDKELAALRGEAAAVLMQSLQNASREALIVESATALGKMRHAAALPALVQVAEKSKWPRARTAAIAAIGLLGSADAEKALGQLDPRLRDERVVAFASFGLLPGIDPQTLGNLRGLIDHKDAAMVTAASWAIRQHHQQDSLDFHDELIRTHSSPWAASESLLAIGQTDHPSAVTILGEVLRGTPRQMKSWELLMSLHRAKAQQMPGGQRPNAPGDPLAGLRGLAGHDPNIVRAGKEDLQRARSLEMGLELIRLGWLRTSAAIALGQLQQRGADEPLLRLVELPADEDEYTVAPKCFAIMSLAAHPSERSRDRLIALVGKNDQHGRIVLDAPRTSPMRGFAALALGLYARPYDTEQGQTDRPGYDWAIMTLSERLEDQREDLETRIACAMGLGLTQRTAVLPILHRATENVRFNVMDEHPLFGYLLLARALAGDTTLLEPAEKYLARRDDPSMTGILARRAVVLSLGVAGSPTAVPVLTKAWHLNHYVNREVILALRLIGASSAAKPVMQRLVESKDEEEKAYMAEVLGELLADEQPTPLSRFIIQSNFTVRNDQLLPLQRMANGFLYDYLIASLGNRW